MLHLKITSLQRNALLRAIVCNQYLKTRIHSTCSNFHLCYWHAFPSRLLSRECRLRERILMCYTRCGEHSRTTCCAATHCATVQFHKEKRTRRVKCPASGSACVLRTSCTTHDTADSTLYQITLVRGRLEALGSHIKSLEWCLKSGELNQ